jgi:translation initiation factor 2 subunit 1
MYYVSTVLNYSDPDSVLDTLNMPDYIKKELVKHIRQRLTPQPIKIRADIECTCFGYEGIDAIKAALLCGEACSTASVPIKIKLVAPPLYVLITNSTDKPNAIATMEKAILAIEENIKNNQGSVTVKMKPRAVSENDDNELKQLMDDLAKENTEVAGDSEEDGESDEGED